MSRRRGSDVLSNEEQEIKDEFIIKKARCVSECIHPGAIYYNCIKDRRADCGAEPSNFHNLTNFCEQECSDKTVFVPQYKCDRDIQQCTVHNPTCYQQASKSMLAELEDDSDDYLERYYYQQFQKMMKPCSDDTCRFKRIVKKTTNTRISAKIDPVLRKSFCRKSNYARRTPRRRK
jgi:hypothetical protein